MMDLVQWWAQRDGFKAERVHDDSWRDDVEGLSINGKVLTLTRIQRTQGLDHLHKIYQTFTQ